MYKVENVTGNVVVADYNAGTTKKGYAVIGETIEVKSLADSSELVIVPADDGAVLVQALQLGRLKIIKIADCNSGVWKVRYFELEKFAYKDKLGKEKDSWRFCDDLEVNKHLRKMHESLIAGFKPNSQAIVKLFGWVEHYESARIKPVAEDAVE